MPPQLKRKMPDEDDTRITMASGCNIDGKPFVHYHWAEKKCQFSPEEARQHALALIHCAEAAEHDAAVFKFLQERLESSREQAAAVIGDLRNFRAGVGGNEDGEQDDDQD